MKLYQQEVKSSTVPLHHRAVLKVYFILSLSLSVFSGFLPLYILLLLYIPIAKGTYFCYIYSFFFSFLPQASERTNDRSFSCLHLLSFCRAGQGRAGMFMKLYARIFNVYTWAKTCCYFIFPSLFFSLYGSVRRTPFLPYFKPHTGCTLKYMQSLCNKVLYITFIQSICDRKERQEKSLLAALFSICPQYLRRTRSITHKTPSTRSSSTSVLLLLLHMPCWLWP